jgi:L-asparaginase
MLHTDTPILLLTTGGTIDKIYFDALSDYQIGDTVVARLLEIGRVRRPFRVEEVTRKDSLDLIEPDRALIRERVAAAPEAHVVITTAPTP